MASFEGGRARGMLARASERLPEVAQVYTCALRCVHNAARMYTTHVIPGAKAAIAGHP